MKRTIEQWTNYDPTKAVNIQGRPTLRIALEDARADILELHAEVALLRAATNAASDYLLGLTIDGFAEEHGGIDQLLQELREAVYKWEMNDE